MMRRLREEDVRSDPALARLAEMVKEAQPLPPLPEMQRRVSSSLRARRRRPARPLFVLRPAMIAIVTLGSMAIASAMMGVSWVEQRQVARRAADSLPRA